MKTIIIAFLLVMLSSCAKNTQDNPLPQKVDTAKADKLMIMPPNNERHYNK